MDGGLPRVPAGGGGANQPPMTVEAYIRFADELLDARRFAALRVGPPGVESYRRGNDWNNYQLGFMAWSVASRDAAQSRIPVVWVGRLELGAGGAGTSVASGLRADSRCDYAR